MATNALINIETIVSRYLFKYKLPLDDAFIYTEHACDCLRNFRLFDSDEVVTAKVVISTNKIIELPDDFQTFVDLVTPISGEWWSFTRKDRIVNTTTFTGLIEGRDADVGEGADIATPRTSGYGARGGINDYNFTLDMEARRIFIDGMDDGTVILLYTTSGIETSGLTVVPDMLIPLFDTYLKWKSSYWLPELARERQLLKKDFDDARLSFYGNLILGMGYNEWRDLFLGMTTPSPQR